MATNSSAPCRTGERMGSNGRRTALANVYRIAVKMADNGDAKDRKNPQLDGKIFKWMRTKLGNWPFRLTD